LDRILSFENEEGDEEKKKPLTGAERQMKPEIT